MSRLHMGIDVGSTTVKVVVLDENNNTLFAEYRRHFSDIKSTVKGLFAEVKEVVKNEQFTVVITGSGGLLLSKMLDLPFVQEVIANKTAIKTFMPETDVVIELGGEDAKILYLSGGLEQRMNGTCAGGTGSFIDQMSILLKTDADGLNALAEKHTIIYPIAARCGVFAKSDVQPLLNEGAAREDIAASILQAVVTQTISGLAQGRPIKGNIVFLGGPLHFLPQLRRQFEETLKDNAKSFKTPENAQLFVAIGAALMYEDKTSDIDTLISQLANAKSVDAEITRMRKLFETEDERKEFFDRHGKDVARRKDISTANGPVFLGLDVGSTTIKAALINEDGDILYDYYGKNEGSPITCGIKILRELYSKLPKSAYIANACTTPIFLPYKSVLFSHRMCYSKIDYIHGGVYGKQSGISEAEKPLPGDRAAGAGAAARAYLLSDRRASGAHGVSQNARGAAKAPDGGTGMRCPAARAGGGNECACAGRRTAGACDLHKGLPARPARAGGRAHRGDGGRDTCSCGGLCAGALAHGTGICARHSGHGRRRRIHERGRLRRRTGADRGRDDHPSDGRHAARPAR